MPVIRASADLRDNYGEISAFCHKNREPVFLTENGRGDLAVMSVETYDEFMGKIELYQLLEAGLNQIKNGEVITEEEMMKKLHKYSGR
ncbi:prevent-host-death protein [Spirochaetia bacterium]|nr:prevent-host-death protein [Spirochaetia bacterium]